MNKRLVTTLVTGTVLALGALAPSAYAQDIDSQINTANTKIEDLSNQKKAVSSQIEQLSSDLTNVQSKINTVQAEQETAKANLANLQAEIAKLEQQIADRSEKLQEQARAVQVNGARSYLDYLLNADSLTDAVNRIGVIMDLVNANREMMQEQSRDKDAVESKEAEQQATLAQQQANEVELQNLQSEMNDTYAKHQVTLANLSQEEFDAIAKRNDLVQEKDRLEKERAIAAAKREAAEKAAKESAAAMLAATESKVAEAAATPAAATTQTPASQAASTTAAATVEAPMTEAATTQAAAPVVVGGSFVAPDPTFVAALNGGYFGQCTYYVYNRFAQLGAPIRTSTLGNAAEWTANAAAAGYSVSSTPRAGTAIVFQQGLAGAHPVYGHVGFVERVNADGSIFISEMNVVGVNVISTRTIPASIAAQAKYINFGL